MLTSLHGIIKDLCGNAIIPFTFLSIRDNIYSYRDLHQPYSKPFPFLMSKTGKPNNHSVKSFVASP